MPSYTRAIVLLAVAGFASQAMVRVADSILPQIAGDFGVSIGTASAIVSAYAIMHGSMQLVIGPLGDRFLWLTADELTGIQHGINAVTDQYFERTVKPELRQPGARLVTVLNFGFPNMSLRDEPDAAPPDQPVRRDES